MLAYLYCAAYTGMTMNCSSPPCDERCITESNTQMSKASLKRCVLRHVLNLAVSDIDLSTSCGVRADSSNLVLADERSRLQLDSITTRLLGLCTHFTNRQSELTKCAKDLEIVLTCAKSRDHDGFMLADCQGSQYEITLFTFSNFELQRNGRLTSKSCDCT